MGGNGHEETVYRCDSGAADEHIGAAGGGVANEISRVVLGGTVL